MVGTGAGVICAVGFAAFVTAAAGSVPESWTFVSTVSTIALSTGVVGTGVSFGAAVLFTASVIVADM